MIFTQQEAIELHDGLRRAGGDVEQFIGVCRVMEAWLNCKAAYTAARYEEQCLRPSMFLPATVGMATTPGFWYAEHSGVYGLGKSPAAACESFDRVWEGVE